MFAGVIAICVVSLIPPHIPTCASFILAEKFETKTSCELAIKSKVAEFEVAFDPFINRVGVGSECINPNEQQPEKTDTETTKDIEI